MSNLYTRARQLLSLFVVTSCALGAFSCANKTSDSEPTPVLSSPPNTAFPMPPISSGSLNAEMGWTMSDGTRGRLADYRGKILVVDFYATWCEPCRESIPHLVNIQKRYDSKDVQVVGLNVGGPDDRVKVAAFADEFHISYPLGFPDKSLMDLFLSDDNSIPQTFVFNREGKLLQRFIGYDESMPGQLEEVIRVALVAAAK